MPTKNERRVYIIRSLKDERYYIGSSTDPDKRLTERHNKGRVLSTKGYLPWELVFKQEYLDIKVARLAEKTLKSYKSRKVLEKIIKEGVIKKNFESPDASIGTTLR